MDLNSPEGVDFMNRSAELFDQIMRPIDAALRAGQAVECGVTESTGRRVITITIEAPVKTETL